MDPNPKVKGKGYDLLKKAGIEVISNILNKENEELNKFYFKSVLYKLPYVTLKIAQSLDGYISQKKNEQTWLTGETSKRLVHRWRSAHDAVLIGANTLRVDDPELTVRFGTKINPVRIIICRSTKLNSKSQIFNLKPENQTWIITSEQNQPLLEKKLNKTGCEVVGLPADSNHCLSILSILKYLSKNKIFKPITYSGAPFARAHCNTSKCPFSAASSKPASGTGHPFSCNRASRPWS